MTDLYGKMFTDVLDRVAAAETENRPIATGTLM